MRAEATAVEPWCALIGEESLVVQCALMLRAADVDVVAVVSAAADVGDMAESEGFTSVDSGVDPLAGVLTDLDATVLISVAHLELIASEATVAAKDPRQPSVRNRRDRPRF